MVRALPGVLLGLIVLGLGMTIVWGEVYDCNLCDFETFAAAARRLLVGEPLYASFQDGPYLLTDANRGRGFVYPPSAAPLLVWTAWLPGLAWRVLNLAALATVAALVMRDRGRVPMLAAVAAVMLFPPTWTAWANGQITPLLAAGFGLAWLYPRWAWAIAGVGGAIKLFPLVLLAWALREQGWRHVALGLVAFAALVILTLPFVGDQWPAFILAARNGEPGCDYGPVNSLRCALTPAFGSVAAQAVGFAVAGIAALAGLMIRWRAMAFLLLTIAAVVASPDLNRPYWLIPLIGWLALASTVETSTNRRKLSASMRRTTSNPST